jgi:hypothetical protein
MCVFVLFVFDSHVSKRDVLVFADVAGTDACCSSVCFPSFLRHRVVALCSG